MNHLENHRSDTVFPGRLLAKRFRLPSVTGFILLLFAACTSTSPEAPPAGPEWRALPLGAVRTDGLLREPVVLPKNAARNLVSAAFGDVERLPEPTEPRANTRRFRGAELVKVYQENAPAVALVLMAGGRALGSAFLIDEEGWLITNHHVAREAVLSPRLTREVTIVFGKINGEGYMEPVRSRFAAEVYKWDERRDLALLKLTKAPAADLGIARLPVIRIASATPAPGSDAAAIGNAGVTLLWSLKPGNVQAVGRMATDTPQLFSLWEARAQASLEKTLGASFEAVRKELENELGAMANVLFIQATCPILPGDSGGPLLNMKGEAIGVTCMNRLEERGDGAAHYFVHARELQDFLKERPQFPLFGVSSPWEVSPDLLEIRDLDQDGQPDTMACFRIVPTREGRRARLAALAWDLNGDSDLRKYATLAGPKWGGSDYDGAAIFENKAMSFQAYFVVENDSGIFAADLDRDGWFEVVRIDSDGDGVCDRDLRSKGRDKPFEAQTLRRREPLCLAVEEMPEAWRQRYARVVLTQFRR